jgi:RNA polymerase sigma-70 factor (ECF subfamily)
MALYHTYTDGELVQLLQGDDEVAFNEIYHRYWQRVYAVGYHFSKQKHAAEETVQQVFMSLWDRREQFTIESSLEAYLATAAKYTVLDQRIKDQRRRGLLSKMPFAQEASDAEAQLQTRILQEYLHKQVEQLPEKTRIIFKYSRETGLSAPEISEVMQISPKTVEAHITKAIKSLRLSLRHMGFWFL